MRYFTLLSIQDKTIHFYDYSGTGTVFHSQADQLIRTGLIEFFHFDDVKQIITVSEIPGNLLTRLTGTSLYVPVSRMFYLPFFVAAMAISLAFAIPMHTKSVEIFGYEFSAGLLIFPLVYIFTDLTNELFGYKMTKRSIRYIAFLLVIMAVLIQISLLFTEGHTVSKSLFSDATSDDIIRGFSAIYTGLPLKLLIHAVSLLAADTFNAFMFSQMKNYLSGQHLWLRSFCSSYFASTGYTLTFFITYQLCCWQWPSPDTMSFSFVIACSIQLIPYFLAATPLIYGIRHYIYYQEEKLLEAEMRDV